VSFEEHVMEVTTLSKCVKYQKPHRLAFADYLVIMAKSGRETKEMMRSLGKYVRRKKLEVNVEKTKIMVFHNRRRRSEKNDWKSERRK
jgi:predicted nucleotidyltransferase